MKVSIVTPFFNSSEHIDSTAKSVLAQTYQNWEWIIVDDGSYPDERQALEVLATTDSRIQIKERAAKKPKGACASRNTGLDAATGNFVIFLDSDDMLAPYCISERIRAFREQNADCREVLYFPTIGFEEASQERVYWDDPLNPAEWLESLLSLTPPCQTSGPFWPTETIKEIGGWNESMMVWQDLEVHVRASIQGINFSPAQQCDPDVLYRILPNSMSHGNFHSPVKTKSRYDFALYCLHHAGQMSSKERKALRYMLRSVVKGLILNRRFRKAHKILRLSRGILSNKEISYLFHFKFLHRIRLHHIRFVQRWLKQQELMTSKPLTRRILNRPYPVD